MAATVRIAILANAAQARRELGTVESAASRMSTSFSKFRAPAAAALGAIGLGAASSIKSASDLAETVNKSSVIFGENAGSIEKWAGGAAKNLGLSKQAALESAAGFGDMFGQLGFAKDEAAKLSTGVVQMSADLGSFNNLPTEDVAQRISSAFRGEYDSLQTLIPNINAARVESEAMAATGKTTASALTAQEKATAVLAIVNKDGARAQGDFARTSDGAANSAKIAAASVQDLSAGVGTALLPAYTAVLQGAIAFLGAMTEHQAVILPVAGVLAGVAVAVLAVSAAQTVAQTAMTVARGAVMAYTAAQWLLNAAMTANPIGLIIAGLVLLVAGLVLAYRKSETFRNIVNGAFRAVQTVALAVWNAIKAAASAVWAFITGYVKGQIAAIKAVIRGVTAVATAVWNAIKASASAVWNAIKAVVTGVINAVKAVISGVKGTATAVWNTVKSSATAAWNAVKSSVTTAIATAKTKLGEMKSKASEVLSQIKGLFSPSALIEAGRRLISGLISGITGAIGGAVEAVRSGLSRIRGLLPGSPIKWGPLKSWNNGGAGKRLMGFLASGIQTGAPVVAKSLSGALSPLNNVSMPDLRGAGLGLAGAGGPTVQVTIQAGVGDPVAIGREVQGVLDAYSRAGGRRAA